MMHSVAGFAFIFIQFFHPFKISVAELSFNEKNESLETTIKIFQDDLEYALRQYHKKEITLQENRSEIEGYISAYVNQKFIVHVNQELMKATFVGYELEGDVIWIYLEYTHIKNLIDVEIENELLLEAFPEQSNLIHFKYGNEVRSYMCDESKSKALFKDFENW